MAKTGRENKRYSAEFKISVIIDMREHRLEYRETARKYWNVPRVKDLNYLNGGNTYIWKKEPKV